MRRLVMLLVAAAAVLSSFGQSEQDDFNGWGIRLGLDVNIPGDWKFDNGNSVDMFRNGAGFTVGAVYNLPLVSDFYFEPGLSIFYDTFSYKDLFTTEPGGTVSDKDPSFMKFGLRMPLVFGYRFNFNSNFSFAVYTGPELSYALSGKLSFKHPEAWGDDLDNNLYGSKGTYRRFDCGWKFGLGFPIGRWFCGVEGTFGMLDLHKGDAKFHENRVMVSVGYDF